MTTKSDKITTIQELIEEVKEIPTIQFTRHDFGGTLPGEPGIYVVVDSDGNILYLGRASSQSIHSRWVGKHHRYEELASPKFAAKYIFTWCPENMDISFLEAVFLARVQSYLNWTPTAKTTTKKPKPKTVSIPPDYPKLPVLPPLPSFADTPRVPSMSDYKTNTDGIFDRPVDYILTVSYTPFSPEETEEYLTECRERKLAVYEDWYLEYLKFIQKYKNRQLEFTAEQEALRLDFLKKFKDYRKVAEARLALAEKNMVKAIAERDLAIKELELEREKQSIKKKTAIKT